MADSAKKMTKETFDSYNNGVAVTQKKVDSVPYERFPFCCGVDNTIRKEVNMAHVKNIVPVKPPPVRYEPPPVIVAPV